jgi:hypothetical protein
VGENCAQNISRYESFFHNMHNDTFLLSSEEKINDTKLRDYHVPSLSVIGDYSKGLSVPKFRRVGIKRFVQINNVGDHRMCVTKIFGETSHDVFVYYSLFAFFTDRVIMQVSSLLRNEKSQEIIFHIRPFKQQRRGTRICGYCRMDVHRSKKQIKQIP